MSARALASTGAPSGAGVALGGTTQDLTALGALYPSWAEVSAKRPVTAGEVNRAAGLGPRLVMAFGRRQQGTDGAGDPSEAYDRLLRAHALFFHAHDECRRAVTFLRWREGDADAFVSRRGTGRRAARESASRGCG